MSDELRDELTGNNNEGEKKKIQDGEKKIEREMKNEDEAKEDIKVNSDNEVLMETSVETIDEESSVTKEKTQEEEEESKETVVEEPRVRRIYFRRKVCRLCTQKIESVDYKDVDLLRRFVADSGKILPRRMTGTCARHQRMLAKAIKRARLAALLPFVSK